MQKLFGVPTGQLLVILLVVFAVGTATIAMVALRNRVAARMAIRNIPRRRAQSALIVLGLMLATLLFSASLTTGDTLTHSLLLSSVRMLGPVDVLVQQETAEASGRPAYFDMSQFERIRDGLAGTPAIDGIAPLARERVPVVSPTTRLSEPQVGILGIAPEHMTGFDRLADDKGNELSLGALSADQAFASTEVAKKLEVSTGDALLVYLGRSPARLAVAGVYAKGGNPAGELSLVLPLARLQALTGNEGRISSIVISGKGDRLQGAGHTETIVGALKPLLEGSGLKAVPVKQDELAEAEEAGNTFATVFLLFGQFSIAAGILLIFLIFVMLAAERKREMGIIRAIGTQRGHVIRMFAIEGAAYAVAAAAAGTLLGVAVGWAMVRIIAIAFGQIDLELTYSFRWQSLAIAFLLGIAFTFVVVLASSWRVSRLNIVRAIRDIPEPRSDHKSVKGLIIAVLTPVLGAVLTTAGLQGEQAATFNLGVSLIIIGLPMLARRFGLADRAAFSIAGVGLVVWWLLPESVLDGVLPDMQMGIEMFFLSGIMIVLGAVWAVIYNSNLLLAAIVFLFGRIKGLPPVLRTAVSYPMHYRFRTGVTLAMFSLVVFTLVVMSFILHSMAAVFEDTEKLAGGFHIRANTSYANPIADIRAGLSAVDGLDADAFAAVASFTGTMVRAKQDGTTKEPVDRWVQGANREYTGTVTYDFAMKAAGYESAQQVWQALQEEPGTVVVSSALVPARTNFNVGGGGPEFQLEGFWLNDKVLPEVFILARDPRTGNEQRLRVIGVLEQSAFYGPGVVTSQTTLETLLGQPAPAGSYMFRLKDPKTAEATAKALEAKFLENGLQAESLADEIRTNSRASLMLNNLLTGFMGLGLVVGIAALGVIAARSVVERRQQIGVLRALGFQREMVQLSFLLESSFVALLGIGLGIALGVGLSYNVVKSMAQDFPGLTYQVPWASIVVVTLISYGASLLTTFLPARQAANVYPAEALRYE